MGNKFVPLGIIIIAVVALVFAKPLLIKLRGQNAQINALEAQNDEASKKIDALKALQPQLASAQSEINALRVAMPAAQQIPEVLVMVEAIAKKTGLKITGVEIQPGGGKNEVGVSLSGTGSYRGLFTFTEVLEKNVRPIQIRSLSIGSGEESGDKLSVTVNLGVVYQGTLQQQVAQ